MTIDNKATNLGFIYVSLCLQSTFSYSRFCRSSLSRAIAPSFSSVTCLCSSFSLKMSYWWVSFLIFTAWKRLVRPSISIACDLSLSSCRTWGNNTLKQSSEVFCLRLLVWKKQLIHPFFISVDIIFLKNLFANWLVYMQHVHCSFDTFEWCFLGFSGPLWCLQFLMFLHHIQVPYTLPWHVSRVFHWWSQCIILLH